MSTPPEMNDAASAPVEGQGISRQAVPKPAELIPPGKAPPPVKEKAEGESWIETVKTIVYALLIALVIRTFLFQPFNIPSGSMENTLLVGDYLFVEKFAYGYSRYSFPFGFPPFPGRVFGTGPQRGDVVVFKMPNANSPDYMKDFIKRVVGLPGDRVQMIDGQVWLNGKPIPKVRAADYVETDPYGGVNNVPRYRETFPGGKSYYVLDRIRNGPSDNTPLYVVPPGHYFMMGDNRDNSADSRADVGYVPAQNIEGKAVLIFFSNDSSAQWWELWKWPWSIRYDRLLTVID
ncbi:MAG TPA: signal peptidase I [Rhizomicrobium sp.]|jgi:signal peptidase I